MRPVVAPRKAEYDVAVMREVMIPMRDGTRLATDIYRPVLNGTVCETPLPVLLERTPYDKVGLAARSGCGRYFAERGYVVAVQDVRGRFRSEGVFRFLLGEGTDGYDTVEWLAAQPWCDGQVGTYGTSYMGWVQSALAVLRPPHLKAMYLNQSAHNGHTNSLRQGGAFELRFLCWAVREAALSPEAAHDPAIQQALGNVNLRHWLTKLPLQRGRSPLRLAPAYEDYLLELVSHGDYDAFWKQPDLNFEEHFAGLADVPTVYSGAWYDSYTRSTCTSYAALAPQKQGPIRLIMGPWTHGIDALGKTFAGDIDLGKDAAVDFNALQLAWFDQHLKGMEPAPVWEAPVTIFVMGGGDGGKNRAGRLNHGGAWRTEREWPLARAQDTPFYLHADGTLRPETPQEADAASTYQYDPRHPVPTIGGNISTMGGLQPLPPGSAWVPPAERERDIIVPGGGFDQREALEVFGCTPPYFPLSARHDILIFETQPLTESVEVIGPITVHLWVSSSAPDTDFTAKLLDVYPPHLDYPEGYDLNLCDGILRMRYHASRQRQTFLEPGQVYPCTIELYPTGNLFQAGHRMRLDISSSNFPRFDVNPNTGEPLGRSRMTRIAENTVYHNRQYPSHVVLPIIPR
jgi:putative CocE/NonD family hydrolase